MRALALALSFLGAPGAFAALELPRPAPALASYFADAESCDKSLPTPRSVLGADLGERHLRHDEIATYLRTLAAASPRLKLSELGRTAEGRPLLALVAARPDRIDQLDTLRAAHRASCEPGAAAAPGRPLVVWLGYGVHGNEPSGPHAALAVAWWLAASPEAGKLLDQTIVLLDPCLNPDGFDRFSGWANAHLASQVVADPEHREHREAWPTGRYNHFLFDLNRDYLSLTQDETRVRLAYYLSWSPDLAGDWHEMGTGQTNFFQPGAVGREHPYSAPDAADLTARIAEHHSRALGALGSLHFTRERFDDFYIGKGSTYPDVTGSLGILFEQASARGLVQSGPYGDLTLAFAVRNQVATSLSTLRAAQEERAALIERRQRFAAAAAAEAAAAGIGGWLIASPEDPQRTRRLALLLARHEVRVEHTTTSVEHAGTTFPADSLWIPAAQPRFRFLRAALEDRTEFLDTMFYDISAWSLARAHGVTMAVLPATEPKPPTAGAIGRPPPPAPARDAFAWVVDWRDEGSARLLQRLLDAGAGVLASKAPLRHPAAPGVEWPAGTLVLPSALQPDAAAVHALLAESAALGVRIGSLDTRLSVAPPDLGSGSLVPLKPGATALVVGEGVDAAEAGAVWFTLDRELGAAVTLLNSSRVAKARLAAYSTILLADGTYERFGAPEADALKRWVSDGGTLVALGRAAKWVAERELLATTFGAEAQVAPEPRAKFADAAKDRAMHAIEGTIFDAVVDATHPLAFGLGRERIALFQENALVFTQPKDPRNVVLHFNTQPLLSGYASAENVNRFSDSPALLAQRSGAGLVVATPASPVFRASWPGTSKLLFNALFFSPLLKSAATAGAEE